MLTTVTHYSAQTREILFPANLETYDHTNVISAIERNRVARIAKLAFFIFATLTTTALVSLSEASILSALVIVPTLLVTLICWGLFIRLNKISHMYLENISCELRQNLAKNHLKTLLFGISLENTTNFQTIFHAFMHINTLLDVDIFNADSLKAFSALDLSNADKKNLFELSQAQGISLALDLHAERFEQGRFGLPSYQHKASIKWDGNKDSEFVIDMQAIAISPMPETEPEPEAEPQTLFSPPSHRATEKSQLLD